MANFSQQILKWFDAHGRHNLPWKDPVIPKPMRAYHIWLSEVMLQQTQVTTVIPYYQRFVAAFPSLQKLAQASQDEVLSLWSGLGYYARGRNLHKAAQQMWSEHKTVPNDFETLLALPGIGRSTAGAIMAQAYNAPYAILDGNVKRVLARYYAVQGWYGVSAVGKQLWQYSETLAPKKRVADYTQAIMDLGATLCTRSKPKCTACPIAKQCVAFQTDRVAEFPHKKPKKQKPVKQVYVLCLVDDGSVLLQQRPPTGIWGGLWSFPEFEDVTSLHAHIQDQVSQEDIQELESFRHTFSHYHLDIHPHVVMSSDKMAPANVMDAQSRFFNLHQQPEVGIAAPVKRIMQSLLSL
ncbi:MAG: A/G-specific adenine glycosylase [Gammaproteobacteria bacterium]|nr:A/G-specific adenine glycosylase [Gammaproteobacteria bacterium]NNM14648.1 A/G-specific adenine glycosylase [Gammaproteobacteria bacterium]